MKLIGAIFIILFVVVGISAYTSSQTLPLKNVNAKDIINGNSSTIGGINIPLVGGIISLGLFLIDMVLFVLDGFLIIVEALPTPIQAFALLIGAIYFGEKIYDKLRGISS